MLIKIFFFLFLSKIKNSKNYIYKKQPFLPIIDTNIIRKNYISIKNQ